MARPDIGSSGGPGQSGRRLLSSGHKRVAAAVAAVVAFGGIWGGITALRDAGGAAVSVVERAMKERQRAGPPPARGGGWWPNRKGFSYIPCEHSGEICGSSTGPVFNSFIATPSYGDERAFFDGRRADESTGSNANVIRDVTEGSSILVLRIYVNNDADPETNATGLGIARDARVRVGLPIITGSALQAVAWIGADNAMPREVQDTVQMTASRPFSVSYEPGSAVMLRDNRRIRLSDSIDSARGAFVGVQRPDGRLPGGFDNALLVELRVRVAPA